MLTTVKTSLIARSCASVVCSPKTGKINEIQALPTLKLSRPRPNDHWGEVSVWQGVCPAGRRLEGREQFCIGQEKPARVITEVAGSPAVGAAAAAPAPGGRGAVQPSGPFTTSC